MPGQVTRRAFLAPFCCCPASPFRVTGLRAERSNTRARVRPTDGEASTPQR